MYSVFVIYNTLSIVFLFTDEYYYWTYSTLHIVFLLHTVHYV
jgi:hypothetical protein